MAAASDFAQLNRRQPDPLFPSRGIPCGCEHIVPREELVSVWGELLVAASSLAKFLQRRLKDPIDCLGGWEIDVLLDVGAVDERGVCSQSNFLYYSPIPPARFDVANTKTFGNAFKRSSCVRIALTTWIM